MNRVSLQLILLHAYYETQDCMFLSLIYHCLLFKPGPLLMGVVLQNHLPFISMVKNKSSVYLCIHSMLSGHLQFIKWLQKGCKCSGSVRSKFFFQKISNFQIRPMYLDLFWKYYIAIYIVTVVMTVCILECFRNSSISEMVGHNFMFRFSGKTLSNPCATMM